MYRLQCIAHLFFSATQQEMDKNVRKLRSKDINPCIEVCISMQATCLNEIMPTTFDIYTGLNVNVISVIEPHDFTLFQESDGSQKCLDANNYDKSMCSAYFLRYKNCRKYWVSMHWRNS